MKTSMAANTKALIKDWIQYLKNLQIVGLKDNPETGKLIYKKPVSVDDLQKFLRIKTDFSPEQISNAIDMMLAKKTQGGNPKAIQNNPSPQEPEQPRKSPEPGKDLSTWMHYGMRPTDPKNRLATEPGKLPAASGNKTDQNTDDVSDIDYRDIPPEPENKQRALPAPTPAPEAQPRKPRFKYRNKGVTEDFKNESPVEVDENDVEEVFNLLIKSQNQQPEETPEEPRANTEKLNQIKRMIRDRMSDKQRKMLWGALNETE